MKSKKVLFPTILGLAIAIGMLIGNSINQLTSGTSNRSLEKINKLLQLIDREYVDKVNTDSILDLTVSDLLSKLDPHSVYISSTDAEQVNESMKGDFVGIGVNFYMYKDSVAVIKTIKNGPSEKAGILAGDRILYANNIQLFNKKISNDFLFSQLKGEKGSVVDVVVYRKSIGKKLTFKLKRDVIPIKSVDVYTFVQPQTGYIKINRFAETTYDEFLEALTALKKKGLTKLIIDLRDNGGGYLEVATKIADEFLKKNALIVKTVNKKGKEEKTFATENGVFENGDLYILINENSASASEVLAGAVQDNDRGTIVGRRSFGKGLVQREMALGDGSMVRLTVARYYTPSGRSIQKPYSTKKQDYFNEFEKRFQSGELYEADSIKVADSLKFKTKKGRIVYGGGGIIPDVFVPISDKKTSHGADMLQNSGLLQFFVFEELDKNRNKFSKISHEALKKEILGSMYYIKQFEKYLYQNGLDIPLQSEGEQIKQRILTEFVHQLFEDVYYYARVLKEDNMIKKIK